MLTLQTFETLEQETLTGSTSALDPPLARGAASPNPGSVIAGRFRLSHLLGEGGMGSVFAAEHLVTGRRVAIKWLRRDSTAGSTAVLRLMREARLAGQIQHPNVVSVYDAGSVEGNPFIVMELLEGESLADRLERGCPSVNEAIEWMRQILRGVAAAHKLGIVHRDLKPQNIFLCRYQDIPEPQVKVLDFGISKLLHKAADESTLTALGTPMGTPLFMSPEQIRGEALDARSDIYSLAVTFYYLLTGRYPFEANSVVQLLFRALNTPPQPIETHRSDLSSELRSLIATGLERLPTRRHSSVGAMLSALEKLPRLTDTGSEGRRQRANSSTWVVGALLCAIVAMLCLSYALGWPSTRGTKPVLDAPIQTQVQPLERERAKPLQEARSSDSTEQPAQRQETKSPDKPANAAEERPSPKSRRSDNPRETPRPRKRSQSKVEPSQPTEPVAPSAEKRESTERMMGW